MKSKTSKYWLLKSEPDVFSIDDLQKVKTEPWTGVRNYQARNFMKAMQKGDTVFFYHSSCEIPGIAGIAKVSKTNVVDHLQFDSNSEYFDPKSSKDYPRWVCVEVEFVKKFKKYLPLSLLKNVTGLQKMKLLQKGSRLSVQPVTDTEANIILNL